MGGSNAFHQKQQFAGSSQGSQDINFAQQKFEGKAAYLCSTNTNMTGNIIQHKTQQHSNFLIIRTRHDRDTKNN